ncbi:hypothetical protein PBI_SCTP2_519 [Salicola phage SCTP-2]|nr:hypothetical protein PBI_SCTP2_519 [Salicola phage SCTP-2]
MKKLLIIVLIMLPNIVYAEFNLSAGSWVEDKKETFNLSLGAWSKHVLSNDISNETHNMIAVQKSRIMGGYFKNSHGNDTFFINYYREFEITKNIEPFVTFGLMYGYTECFGEDNSSKDVCPMGVIGVSYTKFRIEPTLYLLGDAISFGPRIKF